jgi:hypothetical protein
MTLSAALVVGAGRRFVRFMGDLAGVGFIEQGVVAPSNVTTRVTTSDHAKRGDGRNLLRRPVSIAPVVRKKAVG